MQGIPHTRRIISQNFFSAMDSVSVNNNHFEHPQSHDTNLVVLNAQSDLALLRMARDTNLPYTIHVESQSLLDLLVRYRLKNLECLVIVTKLAQIIVDLSLFPAAFPSLRILQIWGPVPPGTFFEDIDRLFGQRPIEVQLAHTSAIHNMIITTYGGISVLSVIGAGCSSIHITRGKNGGFIPHEVVISACNTLANVTFDSNNNNHSLLLHISDCPVLHSITLPLVFHDHSKLFFAHLPRLHMIIPVSPLGASCVVSVMDHKTLSRLRLALFLKEMDKTTLSIDLANNSLSNDQSAAFGMCQAVFIANGHLSSDTWLQPSRFSNPINHMKYKTPETVSLVKCTCDKGFFSLTLFAQAETIIIDGDTFYNPIVQTDLLTPATISIKKTRFLQITNTYVPKHFIEQMAVVHPEIQVRLVA